VLDGDRVRPSGVGRGWRVERHGFTSTQIAASRSKTDSQPLRSSREVLFVPEGPPERATSRRIRARLVEPMLERRTGSDRYRRDVRAVNRLYTPRGER
jgi:hypothetical protein